MRFFTAAALLSLQTTSLTVLATAEQSTTSTTTTAPSYFSGPCLTGKYYCGAQYPAGANGQYQCLSIAAPGAWGCDQSTGALCPYSAGNNYGNANCQPQSNIAASTPLAALPPGGSQSFAQGPSVNQTLCPSGKYYCGDAAGSQYTCLSNIDPQNSQHGCSADGQVCTYTLGQPVAPCYNSSNIHPAVDCPAGQAFVSGSCYDVYSNAATCGLALTKCPTGNTCVNGQCVMPVQQISCAALPSSLGSNLLLNPSFAQGSLNAVTPPSWSLSSPSGNSYNSIVSSVPIGSNSVVACHTNNCYELGNTNSQIAVLSQTVTLGSADTSYLTFWLLSAADGGPQKFQVQLMAGGVTYAVPDGGWTTAANVVSTGGVWTQYCYTVTGLSSQSVTLLNNAYDTVKYIGYDDVFLGAAAS